MVVYILTVGGEKYFSLFYLLLERQALTRGFAISMFPLMGIRQATGVLGDVPMLGYMVEAVADVLVVPDLLHAVSLW